MDPSTLAAGLLSLRFGLGLLLAPPARPRLTLNPIPIHLGERARSEVLTLRNGSEHAQRYWIRAYSWTQTPDGEVQLAPTGDVFVFPTVLEVAAGETRKVSVGTVVAPAAAERTYRVVVGEMPAPDSSRGVQILRRYSIPVFVAPTAPRLASSIVGPRASGGAPRFLLVNDGTVHVRPRTVTAAALDSRGAAIARKSWPGWYVLPGGERVYTVPLSRRECARVRTLDVTVLSEDGDLHQVIALPGGRCGA